LVSISFKPMTYADSLSLRSSMGLAPTTAIVMFFWNLSDVGDRAMMLPAFSRFDVFQSILTPARKVEKHILTPNPRKQRVIPVTNA
jgi:hypothetical protein